MYVYSIRIENAEIDISLLVNKYFAETTFLSTTARNKFLFALFGP